MRLKTATPRDDIIYTAIQIPIDVDQQMSFWEEERVMAPVEEEQPSFLGLDTIPTPTTVADLAMSTALEGIW